MMPGVFVLLWSTGFIGAKFGLPYAEPFTFLLIRFVILVVLLTAVAVAMRAPWPASWAETGRIAISGLLVHGVYLGGVFAAIDQGLSAGITALIVGLQPLLTAVIVGPVLGERVAPRQWGGFVLGVIGVGMVIGEKLLATGSVGFSFTGGLLAVIALCGITFGTVYQKRHCTGMDLRSGSAIQFAAATAAVGLCAVLLETMEVRWTGEFIFAVGWLVLVLSVGATSLLMVMIRLGAVARVASFFYLVPPVTALVGWAMFGESMGPLALAGMAVAAAGVALVVARKG